jgi:hypothetical protein
VRSRLLLRHHLRREPSAVAESQPGAATPPMPAERSSGPLRAFTFRADREAAPAQPLPVYPQRSQLAPAPSGLSGNPTHCHPP